jgi:hypothetical protein
VTVKRLPSGLVNSKSGITSRPSFNVMIYFTATIVGA